MTDVSIPEVAALQQRAKFYLDEATGRPMVEISAVGSKDTLRKKVGPEEMGKFRHEWDAFCDGRPLKRRPGIALTDIPGVTQGRADSYIARNVHNAEELAVLSDSQCQSIGHGTLTDRSAAIALVQQRRVAMATEQRDRVSKAAAEIKAAPTNEPKSEEIAQLGEKIDGAVNAINALVALMTEQTKKAGKKGKTDAAG